MTALHQQCEASSNFWYKLRYRSDNMDTSSTNLQPHENLFGELAKCNVWCVTWWRHQMETFSALLDFCAGNSPVTGEFPAQRPVMRSFDVSFDLRLNKRLSKQSSDWWFEAPSRPLSRHCNVMKHPLCQCFLDTLCRDVTWVPWRLKSPAVQTMSKENIKAPHNCPFI